MWIQVKSWLGNIMLLFTYKQPEVEFVFYVFFVVVYIYIYIYDRRMAKLSVNNLID